MRCRLGFPKYCAQIILFILLFAIGARGTATPTGAADEVTAKADETAAAAAFKVSVTKIVDRKAVFATVRSTDNVNARARIAGNVADLTVDEGSQVKEGEQIALIGDEKLVLRLKSTDARIEGLKSRVANADAELRRVEALIKRGAATEQKLDQLRTALDVVRTELKSAEADRSVIQEQLNEGAVFAPASGRVLSVPVTDGSYVLTGENIASIAANRYVLRLELPERHARFMKKGDEVIVGTRGLETDQPPSAHGVITKVYPEIQGGRVIADAEVKDLGDYFVGERVPVWVGVGERESVVIPRGLSFNRFGIDYVRLKGGADLGEYNVIVQLGRPVPGGTVDNGVEVLAGLKAGDIVVAP